MNKLDLDRLNELKIHVWYLYAKKALLKIEVKTISAGEIESHGGRIYKALRLLTNAGIISRVGGTPSDYIVNKMEESSSYATRPTFTMDYEKELHVAVYEQIENKEALFNEVGYKSVEDLSKTEVLYLYHYQNEFDIISYRKEVSSTYSFNVGLYYLKDQLIHRNKMVLKILVELELMFNFTQYLQLYAGYDKGVISSLVEETFFFNKYAISSVFLNNKIDTILEEYQKQANRVNSMVEAFNKTKVWIEYVGGYPKAIEFIRKDIMDDFVNRIKRFKFCYYDDQLHNLEQTRYFKPSEEDYTLDYGPIFDYIKSFKDIFTYDLLYGDPKLKGTEVFNLGYSPQRGDSYFKSNFMRVIEMEKFCEPESKRAA